MSEYEELVKKLRDDNACLSVRTAHDAAEAIEHLDDLMHRYKELCDKMAGSIDKLRDLCKALYYRNETLSTPPKEEHSPVYESLKRGLEQAINGETREEETE